MTKSARSPEERSDLARRAAYARIRKVGGAVIARHASQAFLKRFAVADDPKAALSAHMAEVARTRWQRVHAEQAQKMAALTRHIEDAIATAVEKGATDAETVLRAHLADLQTSAANATTEAAPTDG